MTAAKLEVYDEMTTLIYGIVAMKVICDGVL